MTTERNGIWRTVVSGIAVGLFGTAVGFGVSQTTIVAQVGRHESSIVNLEKSDILMRAALEEERKRTDVRIVLAVETMQKVLVVNQELVTLLRVQQGVKP